MTIFLRPIGQLLIIAAVAAIVATVLMAAIVTIDKMPSKPPSAGHDQVKG